MTGDTVVHAYWKVIVNAAYTLPFSLLKYSIDGQLIAASHNQRVHTLASSNRQMVIVVY